MERRLFARKVHDFFDTAEKKRSTKGAGKESKKVALLKICKVERAEEAYRGWYEVYCKQEDYAKRSLEIHCGLELLCCLRGP